MYTHTNTHSHTHTHTHTAKMRHTSELHTKALSPCWYLTTRIHRLHNKNQNNSVNSRSSETSSFSNSATQRATASCVDTHRPAIAKKTQRLANTCDGCTGSPPTGMRSSHTEVQAKQLQSKLRKQHNRPGTLGRNISERTKR